jgi:metallo-beta-lactamase class B
MVTDGAPQTYTTKEDAYLSKITNEDKSIVLTKLQNNVWVHTSSNEYQGVKHDHNGLVIVTTKGLVLIDTAWDTVESQQNTKELLQMVENHFKKKVVTAIVTHAHDDSIGGIQELLNRGIDVHSTKLTAELAQQYGYPSPQPTLDANPVLKVGDTVIEAFYPGEGHSKDNITVWLPKTKILFGGCFINALEATELGNINDSNVDQWDDSVQKVIDKYLTVNTVIPGHGQWGDKQLLYHTIDLVNQYSNKVQ